jgi:LacI family transcriptional regulator
MLDINRVSADLQEPSPASLRVRLRDALATQLTDGTLKPGDPFPPEAILQENLEIEPDVIHQVLQSLIDAGLIKAIAGDGNYVLGKTNPSPHQTVGLLTGKSVFHIYYGNMAATFNQCLQTAGWGLALDIHKDQIDTLRETVERMLNRNVRAFAINPPSGVDIRPVLDDLHARGIIVQLVGRWTDCAGCDYVGVNNEQIGCQATQHLIELGHTRIVYVGGASYSTSYERTRGYVKTMQKAGLQPRIFNIHEHRGIPISAEFQAYLDPEDTPTALWREMVRHRVTAAFCFHYDAATWVYNEILKFNLRVPRDVSLIAASNLPAAWDVSVPLTTFGLPGEEMGRQAASLMLRRLAGEDFPPQKVLLPGQLILRSSTGVPRA